MNRPEHKMIYWVIATFAFALLPQLRLMPPAVLVMTLLPLAWRIAAELRGWQPPPAWLRHVATALGLAALFFSYSNPSGRRAAVSLLAVMLALKLIECYRIRDGRLVVSFSLFLCATQFLFTQGILMPVYGAGTVILSVVALTQIQRAEAWRHEGSPPAVEGSLLSELGFSFRLLALAIPIGLAFFLLFPRLSNPLWGIPDSTLDSKTGLSDSMSPGSIQSLFMDDSPAFRAEFNGPPPPQRELYWRGPVFWRFDGRTWKRGGYGKNVSARTKPDIGAGSWRYTVQMEPSERKWLFALNYPASIPPDSRLTMDYQLLRRRPVTQLIEYAMISNPEFIDGPELSEPLRVQALTLPEDANPRTRQLVEEWRQETPGDATFVRRVLEYFNQQPFRYALDAPLLGRHSVDEFLFESRTGFCEHYASTFAVMMRMAGIPSRIVTGYQGGWYSETGNYVLVRQSDAHAWTEVWFPDLGWTRVDPTAAVSPARVQQGSLSALPTPRHLLDLAWFRQARNAADFVQRRWNDWIMKYGAQQQSELFAPLGLDYMTPKMLTAALAITVSILGMILFPIVMRIRGPGRNDPVRRAWEKFLKRLASAGVESRASEGPIELAQAASRRLPGDAESIWHIARLYTLCRYSPDPPPEQSLRHAVKEFRPNKLAV